MREFGKYSIIAPIGSGGMAEVYLAKSHGAAGLEKKLVLKRILPEFARRPKFVTMFIDEAKVAVSLNHPNIVQVYEFGKTDQGYYLAMEHVEGIDLSQILSILKRSEGRISAGHAAYIVVEVAKGLDYAHRKVDEYGKNLGIVHRDVSPQNILVAWDGTVRLVDFGIAKARNITEERAGVVKGKTSYMAPEQALGQEVDQRTDVFSLGAVLYEMLAGRPPYPRGKPEEILTLVRAATIPPLTSINADLPRPLEQIVTRALARSPSDRYTNAREMQRDLMKYLFTLEEIYDAGSLSEVLNPIREESGRSTTSSLSGEPDRSTIPTAEEVGFGGTLREVIGKTPEVLSQVDKTPAPPLATEYKERRDTFLIVGELLGAAELRSEISKDRSQAVLVDYTKVVTDIAYKNGCAVERVDEAGFALLAGIPVSSEDDAETAARVALDLVEAVDALSVNLVRPIRLSVGIATGSLTLERNRPGGQEEASWNAVVDSWELPLRLAKEAMAREILTDEITYRRTRRLYDYTELADFKERTGVPVYRIDRSKSHRARLLERRKSFTTLHGRDYELRLLRQSYQTVKQKGSIQLVVLLGEQGVGKASIVEEFLSGLPKERVEIHRATCSPDLKERPFAPIVILLEDLLNLETSTDIRTVKKQLEEAIAQQLTRCDPEEVQYTLHTLGLLLNIKYPDSVVEPLDSDRRRARIFLSLRRLLLSSTGRGAGVIVINDVQWADRSSLQLLEEIVHERRNHPLLVVLTGRAQPDLLEDPHWQALVTGPNAVVETVKDLPPSAARALVLDLLSRPMDERLVDQIVERSGGSPLFIKEILESLEDQAMLVEQNGVLTLRPDVKELQIPETVEGIVANRVNALPPEARMFLLQMSQIGREAREEELTAVFGEFPAEQLKQLVDRGLLQMEGGGQGPVRYRFRQGLIHKVCSRALVGEERAQIHSRVADHLVKQEGELFQFDVAVVAKHLDAAGVREDAANYYLMAADNAFNSSGANEALSLVNKALAQVDESNPSRFLCLDRKEKLLKELGRAQERHQVLDELLRFVQQHGPAEHVVMVYNRLARYEFDIGSMERAEAVLEQTLKLAEEYGDQRGRALALTLMAAVLHNTGREREAWKSVRSALELYEKEAIDDPEGVAMAWNVLGILNHEAGQLSQALEAYQKVAVISHQAGLRGAEEIARINTGFCLVKMGDYEQALDTYRRVLHEILQLGLRRNEAALLANLGHVQVLLGDYQRAEHSLKRCIRLSRESSDVMRMADGLLTLAVSYLVRGRLEEAAKALRPGLEAAREAQNKYLILHGHLLSSELKLRRHQAGDLEGALEDAERALETAQGSHHLFAYSRAESLRARCLIRMDREEEALEASRRAVGYLEGGRVEGAEEVLVHHAVLMRSAGRDREAVSAIEQAYRMVVEKRDRMQNLANRRQFMQTRVTQQIVGLFRELQGEGNPRSSGG
ncbi:MAG: protein kinase [Bradymonadales bacterium]|nr:protein kinase [Bradymonadales bacterium]